MATLTFSGIPSGIVQTSMDNVTYTEATSPITLVDGMYIWVSSSWQLIGQPVTYVNSVYVNENENDVWSNSRENPFILTYGGTLNYTTSSTQTATSAFIAKYVEQPKTTLDLSTLPDITDGTHTVKVKAKANGYIDSEFSNEVSYTKAASQGYYITFANIAYDETISEHVFIQINGEGDWIDLDSTGSLEEYNDVRFFKIYYVPNGTVTMALLNNDGSYPDNENPQLSPFNITSATSVNTAMTIPVTEGNTDFMVTVFTA